MDLGLTGKIAMVGGAILVGTSSSVKEPVPNLALSNVLRSGVMSLAKTLSMELAPRRRFRSAATARPTTSAAAAPFCSTLGVSGFVTRRLEFLAGPVIEPFEKRIGLPAHIPL